MQLKWGASKPADMFSEFALSPTIATIPAPPRKAAGSDARVGCEPGQVRKEAALNRSGSVPSCPRPLSAAVCFAAHQSSNPLNRRGAETQRRFLTTDFTDRTDKRKNQIHSFLISVNPCHQWLDLFWFSRRLRVSAVKRLACSADANSAFP